MCLVVVLYFVATFELRLDGSYQLLTFLGGDKGLVLFVFLWGLRLLVAVFVLLLCIVGPVCHVVASLEKKFALLFVGFKKNPQKYCRISNRQYFCGVRRTDISANNRYTDGY